MNIFCTRSCEYYKHTFQVQKKWWQAISHVALCNETPWGREQCLLGNYTISQNSSQGRLFMKYIASENEESQIRFYSQVRLFPQEIKTCFQKKTNGIPKGKSRVETSLEFRKNIVGLTLKQWQWSMTNGNFWPCTTCHGASLVSSQMFPNTSFCSCGSSFRCLYGFTYAKIPTLPVIWEKTCFVSSAFVPIRKIIEKC